MNKAVFAFIAMVFSTTAHASSFTERFVQAALERTKHKVMYDGSYLPIAYPDGDVPETIGLCTDVVIRSYRAIGTVLQRLVHEDMTANFSAYPSGRIWGLKGPDRNIDHRRVPNLRAFFQRKGSTLPVSKDPSDYAAGDLVTWVLPGNLPHIGIVSNKQNPRTSTPLIVHNIGRGPELEDMLFNYEITGHYRYEPPEYSK